MSVDSRCTMTSRLILICHASTDAVREATFPADEPLDDKGSTSAAALAGRLPKADQCWSSPELRTRQTAEALGLNANVQPVLRDCDYGRWTGSTFDERSRARAEARRRHGCAIRRRRPSRRRIDSLNCRSESLCGSPVSNPNTASRSSSRIQQLSARRSSARSRRCRDRSGVLTSRRCRSRA